MLSLIATGTPPAGRPPPALPGGQLRDDRVQAPRPRSRQRWYAASSSRFATSHARRPASISPISSQRPGGERAVEAGQDCSSLGPPLAHGQVSVDPRVRLRRAPVERDEPLDRALQVVGVEAVERLGRAGAAARTSRASPTKTPDTVGSARASAIAQVKTAVANSIAP